MTDEPAPTIQPDFYDETRFWVAARKYGLRNLFGTSGSGIAVIGGAAAGLAYLNGWLGIDGVKALSVAYVSLGAALFGIVLAGLAVVAAFFDEKYVLLLRKSGGLAHSLFAFWWVAAVAVVSLVVSVALTAAAYAGAPCGVVTAALAASTILFLAALFESLGLVGTMMRHGLYRAELLASADESSRDTEER